MTTDTFKPDRKQRRNAVIVLILCVVIGLIFLLYLRSSLNDIKEMTKNDPDAALSAASQVMRIFTWSVILEALALALYIIRLSIRTVKHAQFPPPGTWVLRETRMINGRDAEKRGRIGIVLAIVFLAAAGIGCYVLYSKVTAAFLP